MQDSASFCGNCGMKFKGNELVCENCGIQRETGQTSIQTAISHSYQQTLYQSTMLTPQICSICGNPKSNPTLPCQFCNQRAQLTATVLATNASTITPPLQVQSATAGKIAQATRSLSNPYGDWGQLKANIDSNDVVTTLKTQKQPTENKKRGRVDALKSLVGFQHNSTEKKEQSLPDITVNLRQKRLGIGVYPVRLIPCTPTMNFAFQVTVVGIGEVQGLLFGIDASTQIGHLFYITEQILIVERMHLKTGQVHESYVLNTPNTPTGYYFPPNGTFLFAVVAQSTYLDFYCDLIHFGRIITPLTQNGYIGIFGDTTFSQAKLWVKE